MYLLLKMVIFHCHVSLLEGSFWVAPSNFLSVFFHPQFLIWMKVAIVLESLTHYTGGFPPEKKNLKTVFLFQSCWDVHAT